MNCAAANDGDTSDMGRHVRPRFRTAAAVVAVALVAVACGSDDSAEPRSVVVPGTDPWTDTGIDLSIDDTVSIAADGGVAPAADLPPHDPNGLLDPRGRPFNLEGLEEANHAGLIGRIGEAGAPFQVGSELLFTADTAGRLFLGINDVDLGNNAGEFTATITVNPSGIDQATLTVDLLLVDFNAQDAEGVADVFDDDVGFTPGNSEEFVGADAATYWQEYFGRITGERLAEAFHAADGRTYFLVEWVRPGGSSELEVFDVEMDGEQLVRIGSRPRDHAEIAATRATDDIYEAFNDQDLNRLTEAFEGITYSSPSGEEYTGAEAAEHWADTFGSTVARTTGVFAIDGGPAEFVTEYREPDSDTTTTYTVEVEISGGRATSMSEHRPET